MDEKNWDGSMPLFYRVRVAIDVTKPLKKQMKLKKDNDRKAEKSFGAWMRAGSRRSTPSTGLRWVAPEANVDREGWMSPAMEAVAGAGVSETNDKGKEPVFMPTGTTAVVPYVDDRSMQVPTVVIGARPRLHQPALTTFGRSNALATAG
nr:uncharacterized protein LOC109174453 [Ipomoea batatas]